jgi:hypothetical protein
LINFLHLQFSVRRDGSQGIADFRHNFNEKASGTAIAKEGHMETLEIESCAGAKQKQRGRSRFSGEYSIREVVCAVEAINHTVYTRCVSQEKQHAWAYDSMTSFYRCSERITAEDLLPGDMVTVLCEKRGEIMFAKSVRVHLPALHLFPTRLIKNQAASRKAA